MFINKKTLLIYAMVSSISINIYANNINDGAKIFEKKCAMCHLVGKPVNKMDKESRVAPPIDMAMKSVVVTIDAVDGPFSDQQLKEETIKFLKDYVYAPSIDKTNCEDKVIKKFGTMPSLKGFITPKELDIVLPWIYDTFKPIKINGEYQK